MEATAEPEKNVWSGHIEVINIRAKWNLFAAF